MTIALLENVGAILDVIYCRASMVDIADVAAQHQWRLLPRRLLQKPK